MNFLWLAHAIPYPPKAGFLLRSYNLLRELARNHTVDLVAFTQEQWVKTLFPSLEEGLEQSRAALSGFCRNVTFLPIESLQGRWGKHWTALRALAAGSSYTGSWLVDGRARAAIAKQLAENNYDLVHFDTIGLAPYRSLVNGVPTSLMHHNIESHMLFRRADNAKNALARAYFRHEGNAVKQLELRCGSEFAVHVTCSDLDTERLKELLPDANAVSIPNGVDCQYFMPKGTAPRPNSLIFVGTMNWYPNIDAVQFLLKEVWPLLKQRVPQVTLDVAGSSPPESIVQLGNSLEGVTVHGYVPDVRPIIESASLFVCPIRDGGGTKLKLLDAFAMKKCVVAHPIACEGIDVEDGQNVVFASTPAEFVAVITELLADDARRNSIGAAARELVEQQYSFSAIGAEFSALMERVAGGLSSQTN